jgi:hypothetical protein
MCTFVPVSQRGESPHGGDVLDFATVEGFGEQGVVACQVRLRVPSMDGRSGEFRSAVM